MMTKEEMERIWNSREIGLLARSSRKKNRMRKLKVTFFNEVTVGEIEDLVITEGKSPQAHSYSYGVIRKHYPEYKDYPSNKYRAQWVD